MVDEATVNAARAGDTEAFRALTDRYRHELHLHCYRLLGSVADAEDVLQETLLAAWRGLAEFEGRSSVRAWLYRIATNRCLNALRDARRRPAEVPPPPFDPPPPTRHGDLPWLQPYPDVLLRQLIDATPDPEAQSQIRETVELAFVAWLQALPPRQAASLVLRDVLGYSTAEVATMLQTTTTAVKGALQRARASIDQRRRARERHAPPARGSAAERRISRAFAEAFVADDIDGVIALLTDDAWLAMPPAPHVYQAPAAIGAFFQASADWRAGRRFHLRPTSANLQPAFAFYLADAAGRAAHAEGVMVLDLHGDRIGTITRFLDPHLPRRFGLPTTIELSGQD